MNDQHVTPIGRESTQTLLRYAIAALVVGPIVTALVLGPAMPDLTVNYVGPAMMMVVALIGWLFLERGQIELAAHILACGACLALIGIAAFTGGVRSPVMVVFPVLILIYGWLIENRTVLLVTALIMALNIGLWAAQSHGVLPQSALPPASIYVVHAILIYALSAVLTAFIIKTFQRRMADLNAVSSDLSKYSGLLEQNTHLLERAQAVAKVGSWASNIANDCITPSAQCCDIMGIERGNTLSYHGYLEHLHPDDRAMVAQAWFKALNNTHTLDSEHRVVVATGIRWVRQKAEIEFDQNGRPLSAVGIVKDITERKLMQMALQKSEERHRTLIEWMPEAMLVHRNTHIVYANPAAIELFGAPDLASLMRLTTTDLIHPDFRDSQIQRMHCIVGAQPIPAKVESRFLKLDGTVIDVEVQGTAIEFDGGPAIHVSIRDITERKRMEHEIRQLAFFDALTGLPNRRLFNDRLSQVLTVNRRSGCYGALMFLDLDNFKPLNDGHGHACGDQLLVEAAVRLKTCVRKMDTVARFGGDEFVILLSELDSNLNQARQYANTVASKVGAVMATPYVLSVHEEPQGPTQVEHRCTASIGAVVFSSVFNTSQDLLKWADAAMYQAKHEGRNRVCFSTRTKLSADLPLQ